MKELSMGPLQQKKISHTKWTIIYLLYVISQSVAQVSWSTWTPWSSCTRSCGVGIESRERHCLVSSSPAGSDRTASWRCGGSHLRYRTCNEKPCPDGSHDFRTKQCSRFNNVTYNGQKFQWLGHDSRDGEECKLVCRAEKLDFYSVLSEEADDGTRCDADKGVCVRGRCKSLGCDGVLGSRASLDKCNVCGGNNDTCKLVMRDDTKTYSSSVVRRKGYVYVDEIPRGASNIRIWHQYPTSNYLALKLPSGSADKNGDTCAESMSKVYLINGECAVSWGGEVTAANTTFLYQRAIGGEQREMLTASGPTSVNIDIMVYLAEKNKGVHYEYAVPLDPHTNIIPLMPNYKNEMISSRDDEVSSGNEIPDGSREKYGAAKVPAVESLMFASKVSDERKEEERVKMSELDSGEYAYLNYPPSDQGVVDEVDNPDKEIETNKIIENDSRYVWKIRGDGECSRSCGGGERKVHVFCADTSTLAVAKDSLCDISKRPTDDKKVETCNTQPCPPGWVTTPWSTCSTTCGEAGVQRRKVTCRQHITQHLSYPVSSRECSSRSETPELARTCTDQLPPCDVTWTVAGWNNCSSPCGVGMRERDTVCIRTRDGLQVDEVECKGLHRPRVTQTCDVGSCNDGWYHTVAWPSKCMGSCGKGHRSRDVLCSVLSINEVDKVLMGGEKDKTKRDENNEEDKAKRDVCSEEHRPRDNRSCSHRKKCSPLWLTGPWSDCSATCGEGYKEREVVCARVTRSGHPKHSQILDDNHCKNIDKPSNKEKCHLPPCGPQWFVTPWTQCSVSCGGGVRERNVRCIDGSHGFGKGEILSSDCDARLKPHVRKGCNRQPCEAMRQYEGSKEACIDRQLNCEYIVQARFCRYKFYREECCASCQYSANMKRRRKRGWSGDKSSKNS